MDILPQLLINSLITGSMYAVASAGLAVMFGLLRILNFAHGHFMMLGAYLFYFTAVQLGWGDSGWGIAAAAVCTAIAIGLVAAFVLLVFVEPFLTLSMFLPLVATIALASIMESAVSLAFGVNVKSLGALSSVSSVQLGSIFITPIQVGIIAVSLVTLSLLAFLVHATSVGRKLRAVSEHSLAAQSLGIRARALNYYFFIGGALLAALGGIMVALETSLQPTMGATYTIKAFAAMILGGLGNIWGTIVGSYILGVVENLSIGMDFGGYSLPAGYKDAFAFVIILGMLMVKPGGLYGSIRRSV